MKKTIMFLLSGMFMIFLVSNTFAQTVEDTTSKTQTLTIEQKTANAIAEISKVTTLTAEQIEKVTPFLTQFFTQKDLDDAEYAGKEKTELRKVAAKKRRTVLADNMKTVLTDEQIELLKTKWEQFSVKTVNTETQMTE